MGKDMFEGVDEGQKIEDSPTDDVQPEGDTPPETPPVEGAPPPTDGGAGTPPPQDDAFEFEGVSFKGLTPEQKEAVEKGTLRVADYTRKTQELSQIRQNLEGTHQRMLQDPRLFLKYFPPQYLEYVLSGVKRGGQQPHGQSGKTGSNINLDGFEPEVAQVIGGLQQEIQHLKSTLGQYDQRFSTYDARFSSEDEQRASSELKSEVGEALGKYKDLNTEYDKQLIYNLIANDGTLSAADAAARVSKIKKASWSQTIKTKANEQTKVVGVGKSTPPAPRASKTFDEADKIVDQRLSALGG